MPAKVAGVFLVFLGEGAQRLSGFGFGGTEEALIQAASVIPD
jgi:hypothetical protein